MYNVVGFISFIVAAGTLLVGATSAIVSQTPWTSSDFLVVSAALVMLAGFFKTLGESAETKKTSI